MIAATCPRLWDLMKEHGALAEAIRLAKQDYRRALQHRAGCHEWAEEYIQEAKVTLDGLRAVQAQVRREIAALTTPTTEGGSL